MHSGKGGRELVLRRLLPAHRARGRRFLPSRCPPKNAALRARTSRARVTCVRTKNCGVREMSLRVLRERDARTRIARPIVVAVLSFASAVAVAQQRPDAGQILEQQREPLRLPPPPPDEIRPRPPEQTAPQRQRSERKSPPACSTIAAPWAPTRWWATAPAS